MGLDLINNETLACEVVGRYSTEEALQHVYPRPMGSSSSSLFFLQLSAISLVSQLIEICLKPLGQSTIVSHIFGGIILGPSFLGQKVSISEQLFPVKFHMVVETFATFGLMFFLFVLGVKIDVTEMLRPGKKAMVVGLSTFFFTLALPIVFVQILRQSFSIEHSLGNALLFIALSQSLIGSPVIGCLLTELKLLNTDLGRLALSASTFSDLMGISMAVVCLSISENQHGNYEATLLILISAIGLLAAIVYIIRPIILWMLVQINQDGNSIDEVFIFSIFFLVLITGFISEVLGQHYYFGPLILGLAVPDGPPLGATIVSKIETLTSRLFYPTFLAISGLQTNIFCIKLKTTWLIGVVILFSVIVKIGSVMLPSKYTHLQKYDAFVLGLILNARGFLQLIVFNFWKNSQIFTEEVFTLSVISVIVITAIITPLIKILYDPSKKYFSFTRCTIQHAKPDTELRVLVCIHHYDSIPTIINLLDVSHASKESPLIVTALILVELLGKSNPILISHQPTLQRTNSSSTHILNALRQYEFQHEGCAAVEAFTSISPYNSMHEDICRVGFDKKATMLILPFHKQWAIDGSIETNNRAIQNMNLHVLKLASCSIGILIDKGILSRNRAASKCNGISITPYHVAVLFIGGSDDAESLAYGARMAKHHLVDLTVVQFLVFGSENSKDRKRDSDLINGYREANVGNDHFVVVEEVIRDGVGLSSSIRSMEDCFDLIIVGRNHEETEILSGLYQWSECSELGVIGDMLASQDFGTTSTVLVVQQQRYGGRFISQNINRVATINDTFVHDAHHFKILSKV